MNTESIAHYVFLQESKYIFSVNILLQESSSCTVNLSAIIFHVKEKEM